MNTDPEQSLFDACVEASDAAARERLLAGCTDAVLRERVRRLLAVHDEAPRSIPLALSELASVNAPRVVGPYHILERLGEGAMGDVYLAEQQEPVRRKVALKILKLGLGTPEVIARFALERKALAMLAHPNIARILDAGSTGDGRPYFAMEYVAGIAITRYCDERRLPLDERLALFAQVCAGVQHAHLRGIIHRDLKPSNIMVTEIDGQAAPKIIDFGIAKATSGLGDGTDAHTRIGHLLGTPEYMSPEQVQLSPLDIDARTDVYSLGIVLYELLTGSRPYAVTRDLVSPDMLAREIAERDPVRPSTRAAEPAGDSEARAERRGLSRRALAMRLRGDLDWIVLKAIERDRSRRYASPQELAAELERYSRHEAVLAGPPSMAYRSRKFVRRHRIGVATFTSLFVAAILFGAGMAWLARETARERDRANAEAETSRRVTAFTARLFELANPANSGGIDLTSRQLLDIGVRRLESEMARERPETRAALLEAAGDAYRAIGEYQQSARLLGQAAALRKDRATEDAAAYARVLLSEARLRRDQGNLGEALSLAGNAVRILSAPPGIASGGAANGGDMLAAARLALADILRLQSRLDEGVSLVETVLAGADRGEVISPEVLGDATYLLGRLRAAQGRLPDAKANLERALQLRLAAGSALSEGVIDARNALADTLVQMGRSAEAEGPLREIVAAVQRIYGDTHSIVGIAYNNLGNALSDLPDRLDEAEQAYLHALAVLSATEGLAHPEVATTWNNLGALYLKKRQWREAADAMRHAVGLRSAMLGDAHPQTAAAKVGLALALNKLDKHAEAEALLRQAQAALAANLGADHWRTANARYYLGVVLQAEGRLSEAEQEVRPAYRSLLASLGPDHPRTQAAQRTLAELHGEAAPGGQQR